MLNILHLSSAKSWRGGEQQIANLIKELRTDKVKQIVVCPSGSPLEDYCSKHKFKCNAFNKRFGFDPLFAWNVYKTCKKEKSTIIHAHDPQAHTTAVINGLFLFAKAAIVINRRVIFPIKQSFFTKFKYNYSKVKKVICVSHAVKKEVQKIVTEDKTTVIYSSINPSNLESFKTGLLRKELSLNENKQIIAVVSALTKEKGIETFLAAAKILLESKLNLHFVVIGQGILQDSLIKQSEKLQISDSVSFLGFRENVKELLLDIDLLLFTSKSEGLGTSLLEAVEMNVPIVAYNTGGIPEIVKHLETGYLVNEYSATEFAKGAKELLKDKTLCGSITKQAKEDLGNFSSQKMAKSTLMVYNSILGN